MQSVIVTGASAGTGLAIAERFAKCRRQVSITAREPESPGRGRQLLESQGGKVVAVCADVADPETVDAAADHTATEHDGIDAWVDNAMSTFGAEAGVGLCRGPESFSR